MNNDERRKLEEDLKKAKTLGELSNLAKQKFREIIDANEIHDLNFCCDILVAVAYDSGADNMAMRVGKGIAALAK